MSKKIDISGSQYGRLVVLKRGIKPAHRPTATRTTDTAGTCPQVWRSYFIDRQPPSTKRHR